MKTRIKSGKIPTIIFANGPTTDPGNDIGGDIVTVPVARPLITPRSNRDTVILRNKDTGDIMQSVVPALNVTQLVAVLDNGHVVTGGGNTVFVYEVIEKESSANNPTRLLYTIALPNSEDQVTSLDARGSRIAVSTTDMNVYAVDERSLATTRGNEFTFAISYANESVREPVSVFQVSFFDARHLAVGIEQNGTSRIDRVSFEESGAFSVDTEILPSDEDDAAANTVFEITADEPYVLAVSRRSAYLVDFSLAAPSFRKQVILEQSDNENDDVQVVSDVNGNVNNNTTSSGGTAAVPILGQDILEDLVEITGGELDGVQIDTSALEDLIASAGGAGASNIDDNGQQASGRTITLLRDIGEESGDGTNEILSSDLFGRGIVLGDQKGRVLYWSDFRQRVGQPIPLSLEGEPDEFVLGLSMNGRWIAAGGDTSRLRVWNRNNLSVAVEKQFRDPIPQEISTLATFVPVFISGNTLYFMENVQQILNAVDVQTNTDLWRQFAVDVNSIIVLTPENDATRAMVQGRNKTKSKSISHAQIMHLAAKRELKRKNN